MKKAFKALFLWIMVIPFAASSQVEFSPFYGYFMGGSIPYYEGDLKINNNDCYGMILGLPLGGDASFEISYTAANTSAEWRPFRKYVNEFPGRDYGLSVNYLTISGVSNGDFGNNVVGFAAVRVGAAWFKSNQRDIGTEWYFAVSMGLGLKIYFNDVIGLRLQGNLHMPFYYTGSGLYFGYGPGGSYSGVYVGLIPFIFEGDFSGGLIFVIGN
jgi:hypothetical protein